MNSFTAQENTITYINIGNRLVKIEKYCPICNNLFNWDSTEDTYSEEDGETI